MKILAVIITSPAYSASGAVTAAINLSLATANLCDLHLAIMSHEDSEIKKNNLIIKSFKCRNRLFKPSSKIPNQIKNSFWTSDIDKYIEEFKPDIVHFHNPVPPLALWGLAKVCIKNSIPYVISSHGFVEMFDYKKSYNIGILKGLAVNRMILSPFYKTLNHAEAIFLLSPNENAILEKNISFKKRISVIPNGYDESYNKDANRDIVNHCVSKFNIDLNKPVFLYIGNHTFNKGIDIILNSLKYTNKDFQIIIGGKIRSKKEHDSLISSCDLLEGESRYTFTDFLSEEEAIALYKIANCFIFPSRADTFPLVILEAMISELPVISTKVGGIPYQVSSECGILIDPNSPRSLAFAMDDIVKSPLKMLEMGKNSKKRVIDKFTWKKSANIAIKEYSDILASK